MATRGGWTLASTGAAAFVVCFVAGELFLSMFASRVLPGPFAHHWDMFNGVRLFRELSVELKDGTRMEIPWARHVPYNRHGVDYEGRLPKLICLQYPDARSISIHPSPGRIVTTPCRR